jgi:hypothetical protein
VISVTEAELEMDADLIDLASLEGQLRVTDGTLRLSRGRVVLPAAKQLELIRATLAFTDTTLDLTDDTDGFDVAFLLDRTTVNGPGRLIIVGSLDAAYSTFNAPLVNRSGADTLFSGVTHIDGDVINEPGAQMAFLGTVNVDGTLTNEPGAALRIFGRDLRDASVVLHERFVNDGVVRLLSGRASLSAALTAAAGFINNGTIELAARGAATIDLPTGTLVNHGVIDILPSPGGNANPPRTIAASLHNAEGGVVSVQSNATIGLPGASLVNAGSMSVSACRLDAPGSDFENRGVFQLIDGGMYFSVGSYVQTAGQTLLAGGVLGSGTLIEGGELTGDGTVGPFLINTGRVSPGSPVGRIDVVGGYTQTPGGVLHIEIAGTDPVEFDTLAVGGGAMLDGTLEASLEGGFEPTPGDRFAFLPSSSRSGRFADVIAPCLAPRSHWQVNYNPADVTLEAAPPLAGDMNCDCALDAFDIEPFVLALFDPAGYAARHPDCDIDLADLNGDGRLDALDIEPFVALLLR